MKKLIIAVVVACLWNSTVFAEWINPQKLERNKYYRLSKATLLMPEKEVPASLEEYEEVRKIPRRGMIKILRVVTRDNVPLYRVKAKNPKKELIGKGWVNSIALMGQEIEEISKRKWK